MTCTYRTPLNQGFRFFGTTAVGLVLLLSFTAPGTVWTQGVQAQGVQAQGVQGTGDALHISGRLVEADGRPIAGAVVLLRPTESPYDEARFFLTGERLGTVAEGRSSATGEFSLRAPGPGFWNVHFIKVGFGNARILPYTAFFEDTRFAPIELGPSRQIEVAVSDETDQPIAGATVQIYPPGYLDLFNKANRSVRVRGAESTDQTNPDGIAVVEAIRANAHIVVRASGFLPARVEVDKRAESATAVLEKASQVSVDLRLPGPEAKPAGKAVVFVNGIAVATADREGQASIPVPKTGSHTIKVLHESQASLEMELSLGATQKPLTLLPPTQVRGLVLDADTNKGIPKAWVWEWRSHPTQTKSASDEIKAGSYTLETPAILIDTYHRGQARQSHYLAASAPGYFGGQSSTSDTDFGNDKGGTLNLKRFARITGKVVDHRGRPIAGVALNAVALNGRGAFGTSTLSAAEPAALSQRDGAFALTPIIPGVGARIDVRASGFATASVATDPLESDDSSAIEIRLVRGLLVSGQIVDEGNLGIPGATVALSRANKGGQQLGQLIQSQMSRSQETLTAATDIEGHFEFVDFSAGHYDVSVSAPTFAPAQIRTVEISAPEAPADPAADDGPPPHFELGVVVLSPGAILQGVIRDSAGRTVEGVEVTLEANDGTFSIRSGRNEGTVVATDSGGRFEFDSLQEGVGHQLQAKKDGFAEAGQSNVLAPTDEPVEMVLERAVDLTGRVINEEGKPLERARIRAQREPTDTGAPMTQASFRSAMRSESTDSDGKFVLENLKQGTWSLAVTASGYITADHGPLEIDPTKTPPGQTIRLEKGATLEGRVTGPDGEPLARARVGERQPTDPRIRRSVPGSASDGEGRYTLEGLKVGPRTFAIQAKGFQAAVRDLEIRPGKNQLDVALETGFVVSGQVFGTDGEPLAGARVNVHLSSGGSFMVRSSRDGVVSAADGAFSLDGQNPGTYQVVATKEGLPPASLDTPIVLQADYSGVQLRFAEGASIVGTVSGLSFDELAQVELFAMANDRSGSPILGKADFEGNFRLDNATPGTWQISANLRSSRRNKSQTIEIPEGGGEVLVNIEFNQGFTASGQVLRTGSSGNQLPASQIRIALRGSDPSSGGSATTNQDGRFEILDLSPGQYTLVAGNGTPPGFEDTVQLNADREFTIELTERTVAVRVVDDETGYCPRWCTAVTVGTRPVLWLSLLDQTVDRRQRPRQFHRSRRRRGHHSGSA